MRVHKMIFLSTNCLFRSLCHEFRRYRNSESLRLFKTKFSCFCAVISVKPKSRADQPFESTANIFLNNINEERSLVPSYGSVSPMNRKCSSSSPAMYLDKKLMAVGSACSQIWPPVSAILGVSAAPNCNIKRPSPFCPQDHIRVEAACSQNRTDDGSPRTLSQILCGNRRTFSVSRPLSVWSWLRAVCSCGRREFLSGLRNFLPGARLCLPLRRAGEFRARALEMCECYLLRWAPLFRLPLRHRTRSSGRLVPFWRTPFRLGLIHRLLASGM
jgi:hypothetical protein